MIKFLLLCILAVFAFPLAALAAGVWLTVVVVVVLLRVAALVFGIAAWAGLGAAIMPGAIVASRRRDPRARLCAHCGRPVVPHDRYGWTHDSGAVMCMGPAR